LAIEYDATGRRKGA